jgi:hypothetical protein
MVFTVQDEAMTPLVLQTAELLNMLPDDAVLEINAKTVVATVAVVWPSAKDAVLWFETYFAGSS